MTTTRFKSGSANPRYRPVGTERIAREGYLERKINDDLPHRDRWRAIHLLRWEEVNGPLPADSCLKSLDGDRTNTAPGNWIAVPRAITARLAANSGRHYDQAPVALKPTILLTALLEQRVAEVTS